MIKRNIILFFMFFVSFHCKFLFNNTVSDIDINIDKLGQNLYKMSTKINNWLVLAGPDGALLSDSAPESLAVKIKEQLKQLGIHRIRFIINTHWHHDHTGGNLLFGRDAIIIGHQSTRDHLSQKQEILMFKETFKAYPAYAVPNFIISSNMKLYINGEEINIIPLPGGHTAGDMVVYFKNANVLHIGDIYVAGHFPMIDYDHGGDAIRLAANLAEIIKIMPDDVKIVSGHIQDGSKKDLVEYHEMILKTIEIVRQEMKKGKNLEEMQKADILKDWQYLGQHVSCNMWLKSIYLSLSKEAKK